MLASTKSLHAGGTGHAHTVCAHASNAVSPADLRLGLGLPLQGPVIAKVHLLEDAWEVLLHPGQRRLLDAVLPRGDNYQIAAAAQALQAVVCSCTPSPASASQAVSCVSHMPDHSRA